MEKKVTRRATLERCLRYLETLKRMDSKDMKGQQPRDDDYEDSFYELEEQCRIVREIIQDYQNPGVLEAVAEWRRDPAGWQREHMENPEKAVRETMIEFNKEVRIKTAERR